MVACNWCARSFVVSDGRRTLASLGGGCPACGIGRWRLLGPEWPSFLQRLRLIVGLSDSRTTRRGPA